MKQYHIHLYKVIAKAETDIEADGEEEALKTALEKKDQLDFGKSDCKIIALDFENYNTMVLT
jgi:hypothetical protein